MGLSCLRCHNGFTLTTFLTSKELRWIMAFWGMAIWRVVKWRVKCFGELCLSDFGRKWPLNDLWPLICVDPICTDLSGFRWPNHVTIACCLWEKKRFRANWHFWALYLGQRSHPCQSHVTGAAYASGQIGQVSLKSVKVWRRYGHVTQVSRLTRTVKRKRNNSGFFPTKWVHLSLLKPDKTRNC